ncbi:glycosyltransferase family 4 protein [Pontibacter beigongshangensis]|uniref:glycosyltransferase family 4 protein n=1 Tax=Pontibacter beigongshangensis TaxID=2574733 RepID=UPI00164EE12C|nr:glycosyltransferase family 4 protein [Pontibacter beigongshangensis]
MRITLLHQHHHNPDCPATCRHYTFMGALAQRHQIRLITSSAWRQHSITHAYSWVPEGVELHECDVPYKNKMNVSQRLFSYSRFAAYCLTKGLAGPAPDIIWAVSTPLSTPWVAARVAALRRVPWVFEVQDLWPSFPITMGAVKNKWLQRRLYQQERSLYHSASHIITLSPDMTDYVASLGVARHKITTNLNGTDLHLAQQVTTEQVETLRQQLQLQGKQVVLYAGTFGRANDIPGILRAAAALVPESQIQFVFTGGGYYEPQVQELARKHTNLTLVPPLPRHQVFALFKLATVSLVTFNDLPVLATNSPAKFYDSLVCGTPVIVTNPGWTKAFVERFGCGWYVPAENPAALALTIKQALDDQEGLRAAGARGAMVAKKQFDRLNLVLEVEDVLKRAAK